MLDLHISNGFLPVTALRPPASCLIGMDSYEPEPFQRCFWIYRNSTSFHQFWFTSTGCSSTSTAPTLDTHIWEWFEDFPSSRVILTWNQRFFWVFVGFQRFSPRLVCSRSIHGVLSNPRVVLRVFTSFLVFPSLHIYFVFSTIYSYGYRKFKPLKTLHFSVNRPMTLLT